MDHAGPPILFEVLFPLFFLVMWCGMGVLLSMISGWRRLAASFSTRSTPVGRRFVMQSGEVGLVSYTRCLTIHSAPEGFFLSTSVVFRFGHPRLFVPWEAVHNLVRCRHLWGESVVFDVGSPRVATVRLPARVFQTRNPTD